MPVIMGTAGHIDHGKTSLVKALTGIDCDRLVEEKKRGITIELGFAYMDLPGVERLGVVDVPGHERFVRNMVAGAAGIDFVMLVVAADEGVMPQTREHLEICSLLGIETGLVALTKTDMVDPELQELAQEDVRSYLAGSFLAEAPIMPVSAHTGQGLDELRAEIVKAVKAVRHKRRADIFRIPIDRVFTMRGHGTVVTGTLVSGAVKVGDDVTIYPRGLSSKVRGLQVHGKATEQALAGQRTAVNLAGLEVEDLERGEVLAHTGELFPSTVWDVELTCLASAPRPLRHRTEIHFHHGSREVLARVYLLDRDKLMPGEKTVCQIRFADPLAGVHGDRCVVRSYSPLRTIAGGRLVNPIGRKVRRKSGDLERLAVLASGTSEAVLLAQLELAGESGLSAAQLKILTDLEGKALDKMLADLGGKQKLFLIDREARVYVSGTLVESLAASLEESLAEFHRREPMKQGASKGGLASTWGRKLPPRLFHFILERTLRKGSIVADQEVLRLAGHKVSLASDTALLREKILSAYASGGLTPPNLKDVLDPLGLEFKEAAAVFKLLQEQGELVKIKEDMYFHAPAVADLKARVAAFFATNEEMGPVEFKEIANLSRKYAIPLMEFMDKEKFTVRIGDKRRLRKA